MNDSYMIGLAQLEERVVRLEQALRVALWSMQPRPEIVNGAPHIDAAMWSVEEIADLPMRGPDGQLVEEDGNDIAGATR